MKITTFIDARAEKALEAKQLDAAFMAPLLDCQALAVAVNLQGKHAVLFETDQHGISCQTWLAARNAQHESWRRIECAYGKDPALFDICDHLQNLLDDSAGGAE